MQILLRCLYSTFRQATDACLSKSYSGLILVSGMYTGYNTLSMALTIPEDGKVVACEIDDGYVQIAKSFFEEVCEHKLYQSTKTVFNSQFKISAQKSMNGLLL